MARVRAAVADPEVREIWLSSEDTGAYGRDLGTNLPELLGRLVAELPADQSKMLRVGMTNPPFILEHLEAFSEHLAHPCVFCYLHVPVQSGSDRGERERRQLRWAPGRSETRPLKFCSPRQDEPRVHPGGV